jgi:hypothetical protein
MIMYYSILFITTILTSLALRHQSRMYDVMSNITSSGPLPKRSGHTKISTLLLESNSQ